MPGNESPLDELVGFVLVSIDDEPVGVITHVFDDTSAQVRVAQIDLDGRESTLVPLLEHSRQEDEATVVFDAEWIRQAPLVTEPLDYRTLQQALDAAREHFARTSGSGAETTGEPTIPAPEPDQPPQRPATASKFAAPAIDLRILIVGWILPFALVAVVFSALVLPSLQGIRTRGTLLGLAGSAQGLVFAGIVLAGGLLLYTARPVLYRFLEGLLFWPEPLAETRRQHHLGRRDRLRTYAAERTGARAMSATERLRRYPAGSYDISPTLLGNAIRRSETYAFDRYRLDAPLLWSELCAVAPGSTDRQEHHARATVDFYVCLLTSTVLLGIAAFAALVAGLPGPVRLGMTVILAIVATGVAYRGAVVATDGWASSVRTVIDLGRIPLAQSLGLAVPTAHDAEQQMWARIAEPAAGLGEAPSEAHGDQPGGGPGVGPGQPPGEASPTAGSGSRTGDSSGTPSPSV